MRKSEIFLIVLTVASIIAAFLLYPHMPEQMASHWNTAGEVDGYMSRFWGLAMFPIILTVLSGLFIAIPHMDPLQKNIKKFRPHFDGLMILLSLFFVMVFAQSTLWNVGIEIPMNITMPIAMGILFFYIGILLGKSKQNWFVGIRTPWTLSSESVWDKTHKLGEKLFKGIGVLSVLSVIYPSYTFIVVIALIIITVLTLFIYSFLVFKKEVRLKK